MIKTLTIDGGNTTAKINIFEGDTIVESCRCERLDMEGMSEIIERHNPAGAIFSTVGTIDARFVESLRRMMNGNLLTLTHTTPLPISIDYRSESTLGLDRIAAAVGASALMPGQNLLVADAGSALTTDLVDASATFRGGNISPGMRMRFKALHDFTAALPAVDASGETPMLGYDTFTAIRSGVMRGMAGEISALYHALEDSFHDLRLVLTGGDASSLVNLLQCSSEKVTVWPHLTAIGLNSILHYNETI